MVLRQVFQEFDAYITEISKISIDSSFRISFAGYDVDEQKYVIEYYSIEPEEENSAIEELKNDGYVIKHFVPGSYGCHEALDRVHMFVNMLDSNLADHPSIKMNDEWLGMVENAIEILADLYQKIGAKHC